MAGAVVASTANAVATSDGALTIHVDANLRGGAGDGTSWTDAFRGPLALHDAMASLVVGQRAEIWIADGTYLPAGAGEPMAHLASFHLRSGVALLGGFAGGETSRDQRDPSINLTILTGDLAGDDVLQRNGWWQNAEENVEHVVQAVDVDGTGVLDGVIVRRGSADSAVFGESDGGNLRILGGGPTILGCVIEDGHAVDFGAGVSIAGGSPTIRQCVVRGNGGTFFGAGLNARDGAAPLIEACLFTLNRGGLGIGIGLGDLNVAGIHGAPVTATIRNCRFENNGGFTGMATGSGAGAGMLIHGGASLVEGCSFVDNTTVAGGGGVFLLDTGSHLERCDFVGNIGQGDGGGAFYAAGGLDGGGGGATSTFVNCRFTGNNGVGVCGGGLSVDLVNCTMAGNGHFPLPWPLLLAQGPSTVRLFNCIAWNNGSLGDGVAGLIFLTLDGVVQVDSSCIQEWDGTLPGTGTFAADPAFADAPGADGVTGTEDDDLRLSIGSPCIDSGANALVPPTSALDLDGAPRFVDDPATPDLGLGEPPLVDRGAHEFPGAPIAPCVGDLDRSGTVDGADLGVVLGGWGACLGCAADLNSDGVVDGADLGLLLGAWGSCR